MGLSLFRWIIYQGESQKCFRSMDGKTDAVLVQALKALGDKAAEASRRGGQGRAVSCHWDDFRQRTKVSKTVIDLMSELGLFGNLPKSNQLSLFDF